MANGLETNINIQSINKNLPQWATETTLIEIQDEVKKLVDVIGKKQRMEVQKKKTVDKDMSAFEKSLQALNEEGDEYTKTLKAKRKTFGETAESLTDDFEKIRVSGRGGYNTISSITNIGQGLRGVLGSLINPLTLAAGATTLFLGAISGSINYIAEAVKIMIPLYDTGITFQNGLGGLIVASSDAGSSIEEYSAIIKNHSALFAIYGDGSAKQFSRIALSVQQLTKSAGYYGLTLNETNEFTAEYLEQLRLQGVLGNMTDRQKGIATANYIKELTQFSQVAGKSRQEILKEASQFLNNKTVKALINIRPGNSEALKAAQGVISSGAGEFANERLDLFAQSLDPFKQGVSDLSRVMAVIGDSKTSDMINTLAFDLRNGTVSIDDAKKQQTAIEDGIQNLSDFSKVQLEMQVNNGGELASAASLVSALILQYKNLDRNKKLVGPDPITTTSLAISNLQSRVKNKFMGIIGEWLIVNEEIVKGFLRKAEYFAEAVGEKMIESINFVTKLFDPKTRTEALETLATSLKDLFAMLFQPIFDWVEAKLDPTRNMKDIKEDRDKAIKAAADMQTRIDVSSLPPDQKKLMTEQNAQYKTDKYNRKVPVLLGPSGIATDLLFNRGYRRAQQFEKTAKQNGLMTPDIDQKLNKKKLDDMADYQLKTNPNRFMLPYDELDKKQQEILRAEKMDELIEQMRISNEHNATISKNTTEIRYNSGASNNTFGPGA